MQCFGHLIRMDKPGDDARRILTTVPKTDWKRVARRPQTSWLAAMKNDLSSSNVSVEDATELSELTLDRPLSKLLAASGAVSNNDVMMSILMPLVNNNNDLICIVPVCAKKDFSCAGIRGIQPITIPVPVLPRSLLLGIMPDLEQLWKTNWISKN